jgi:hypothetical protein
MAIPGSSTENAGRPPQEAGEALLARTKKPGVAAGPLIPLRKPSQPWTLNNVAGSILKPGPMVEDSETRLM